MSRSSRRSFLHKLAWGSAAMACGVELLGRQPDVLPEWLSRRRSFSANDHIQIAVIGAGGMGIADVTTALSIPGVQIVAACDLYDGRLAQARQRWGKDLFVTRDYREILARSEIDAVIVATPDFWHKKIAVEALAAGKAVYCEKPMVYAVDEGAAIIAAQQQSGKVFQVGSQGMSSLGNEKAKELYEAGAIGQLNYAEGFWARNSPLGAWQYPIPEDASPETVDWDRYLSITMQRPWDPLRFFRWRNYRDYGTGVSGDLFVHLFSSLHYITSSKGPRKIVATGGLRYWKDGREVPDVLLGIFDYPECTTHPGFNLSLRVNFVDGTSGNTFLRLVGNEGAMDVTWNDVFLYKNISVDPLDDAFFQQKISEGGTPVAPRARMLPPKKMHYQAEPHYKGAHYDHFVNFFHSMRTGNPVIEDALFGYRAAAPALLCNNSYFEERIIRWDPEELVVVH